MMCVGDLIAAKFFDGSIESAFSHFSTQRTWVVFTAFFKNDPGNLCIHDFIGNFKRPAHSFDWLQIKILETKVHGDGSQIKRFRIKAFQAIECTQKRQAVFSSGNADCDVVAFVDHLVSIDCLTGET